MNRKKQLLWYIPFALFALFFLLLPLVSIGVKSFLMEGQPSLGNYGKIFANQYYTKGIINSLKISLVSSLIGIILVVLASKALFYSQGRGMRVFLNILNMTSNFQGIPLTFSFMLLLGNAGFFTLLFQHFGWSSLAEFNIYSEWGLILIYIYFQIPMGTILLYPAFEKVKQEYFEVAALYDSTPRQFYRQVALPIIWPDIMGTFVILFSNALAAYAIPFALMGTNFPLIPVQISSLFTGDVMTDPNLGSAFSVLLICILLGVNVLANQWMGGRRHEK